eukprot:6268375-Prymnesium_polylepis.2
MHSSPAEMGIDSEVPSSIVSKCEWALMGSWSINSWRVPLPCDIQFLSMRARSSSEAGRRCRSLWSYVGAVAPGAAVQPGMG